MRAKESDRVLKEEKYKSLSQAILVQAVKDYRYCTEITEKDSVDTIYSKNRLYVELKRFFMSEWCNSLLYLSGIDRTGKELFDFLRGEIYNY